MTDEKAREYEQKVADTFGEVRAGRVSSLGAAVMLRYELTTLLDSEYARGCAETLEACAGALERLIPVSDPLRELSDEWESSAQEMRKRVKV